MQQVFRDSTVPVYQIINLIYMLTAIGLTPGGSSTVHIYTQNNTENDTMKHDT